MKPSSTTIGFGIATIVVLGGLYWYFFMGSSSGTQSPLTATAAASPQTAQFLQLTNQLNPISFDTSVLSDPRFLGLVNISVSIASEASGRSDPFAPF